MSRIRFVADVHIGNHKQFGGESKSGINARCRRILDVLRSQVGATDKLVVLGDLFDTSHPSPQIIAATQDVLSGVDSYLLLGNHDMVSDQQGDNALSPMLPVVKGIYERPEVVRLSPEVELLMVPFRMGPMSDWFAEAVGDLLEHAGMVMGKPDQRVICFHGGVRDHNTPKFLWSAPDAIDLSLLVDVMKRANIDRAVCGNWHNPRTWTVDGKVIEQVGAMVPTGFDNAGWQFGTAVEYCETAQKWTRISLSGPKFVNVTLAELGGLKVTKGKHDEMHVNGHLASNVFVKVKLAAGQTANDAHAVLASKGLTNDDDTLLGGVVFSAADEDTEHEEKEAAEAARTADSLDAALREYVNAMPLPDGVEREAVHAKVSSYMGKA